jgi:hypothetical protein
LEYRNSTLYCLQKRDLSLAYIFVAFTYFFIGGIFFLIFPLEKMCIEDVSLYFIISYIIITETINFLISY